MATHLNILDYFFQAGPVVKFVMLILFASSVISWTLIVQRFWFYKTIKKNYETFIKRFEGCTDVGRLFSDIDSRYDEREGLTAIFYTGYKEFLELRELGYFNLDAVLRVMQINRARQTLELEKHLGVFASIGSIAPFVGLFGTVWGIMTSFQALGHAHQATIALVAPGISEALIATALGLFTAIPAVIAYNRFSTATNEILNKYEMFEEELIAKLNKKIILKPIENIPSKEPEYA